MSPIINICHQSAAFITTDEFTMTHNLARGLPWGLSGKKNSPANAGDAGSIPGLRRSPGEGNGYLFQYSCLGNPMDKGAWQAKAHVIAKSQI